VTRKVEHLAFDSIAGPRVAPRDGHGDKCEHERERDGN
jgi:hypothetical protein